MMSTIPSVGPQGPQDSREGILNLDKPAGMTSHDVVARVRRLTGQRKVGHAGTLDPMATGVLLLCLGRATRIAEYLMNSVKRYRATVRLGIATDTYDAAGHVTTYTPSFDIPLPLIEDAAARWRGVVQQVPPPFSAIHHGGRRMYELARKGEPVSSTPRTVEIKELHILAWEAPLLTLEVECSPGTYIRSLAHDLGQAVGVGAHLAALTRLGSGHWVIDDTLTLRRFEADVRAGNWERHLHAIDEALTHLECIELSAQLTAKVLQGQQIQIPRHTENTLLRAYSPNGAMIAILRAAETPGLWHPHKVFHERATNADSPRFLPS
jgi:tRNA pseudouridine55 synthase